MKQAIRILEFLCGWLLGIIGCLMIAEKYDDYRASKRFKEMTKRE